MPSERKIEEGLSKGPNLPLLENIRHALKTCGWLKWMQLTLGDQSVYIAGKSPLVKWYPRRKDNLMWQQNRPKVESNLCHSAQPVYECVLIYEMEIKISVLPVGCQIYF